MAKNGEAKLLESFKELVQDTYSLCFNTRKHAGRNGLAVLVRKDCQDQFTNTKISDRMTLITHAKLNILATYGACRTTDERTKACDTEFHAQVSKLHSQNKPYLIAGDLNYVSSHADYSSQVKGFVWHYRC